MARTRQFSQQRDDAYKLADLEGFTDRYPASEVGRYINQGNAECWDLLVANRGFSYFGRLYQQLGDVTLDGVATFDVAITGDPIVGTETTFEFTLEINSAGPLGTATFFWTTDGGTTSRGTLAIPEDGVIELPGTGCTATFIDQEYETGWVYRCPVSRPSTVAGQRTYELPSDFYKLHQLYLTDGQIAVVPLEPVDHVERPYLDGMGATGALTPGYYEIRNNFLDIWPVPSSVFTINLWYVPTAKVLVNDTDTFDGINGWEDYGVHWAARKMLLKEGDVEMANLVTQDLNKLAGRINNMSAERDAGQSYRVQDVRGAVSPRRQARLRYMRA